MPNVVGKQLDAAKAELTALGFAQLFVAEINDAGCLPRIVCRTNPNALDRAGLASVHTIFVGFDPNTARPSSKTGDVANGGEQK